MLVTSWRLDGAQLGVVLLRYFYKTTGDFVEEDKSIFFLLRSARGSQPRSEMMFEIEVCWPVWL